jgi:hypothetical protein
MNHSGGCACSCTDRSTGGPLVLHAPGHAGTSGRVSSPRAIRHASGGAQGRSSSTRTLCAPVAWAQRRRNRALRLAGAPGPSRLREPVRTERSGHSGDDCRGRLRPEKVARYPEAGTSRSRRKCSRRFDPVPGRPGPRCGRPTASCSPGVRGRCRPAPGGCTAAGCCRSLRRIGAGTRGATSWSSAGTDASPVSVARSMVGVPPPDIELSTMPAKTLWTTWKAIGASIPPLMIAVSPVLTATTTK